MNLGRSRYQSAFVLTLVFGTLWIWLTRAPAATGGQVQPAETTGMPQKGFPAPDFALQSLEGETVRLSDFRGRPVVVNFWATWCAPCRAELPAMQKVADKYGDQGLVFLLLNQAEKPATVKEFLDSLDVDMLTLLDSEGRASGRYRVRGLPTTVFIGPDGTIADIVIGGPITEAKLTQNVEQIMQ